MRHLQDEKENSDVNIHKRGYHYSREKKKDNSHKKYFEFTPNLRFYGLFDSFVMETCNTHSNTNNNL